MDRPPRGSRGGAGDAGANAPDMLYGVHPVEEALQSRPGAVERLFTSREKRAGLGRVLRLARISGVPVTYLPRDLLARKIGRRGAHQGVAAQVAPIPYHDAEALCRAAIAAPAGWLVALDGVVDPGNLGAALRTCAAVGVDGVVLAADRSAGLTPVVAKASAGAVERVPVARDGRLPRRLEALGEAGFRVLALDPRGERPWDRADLTGRIVIVAGGEQRGPRPSTLAACTERLAIPLARGVESLNVAVALGVLLFEAFRQRRRVPGRS